jgi:formylglycine-generating enzyme required for sulfatase activity/tRNA A-37 threonylcarbamoyl transferase component Bud32
MSKITDFAQFRDRYQYDPKKDKLGEGGFGIVYKARDKARTRTVAIKRAIVKENQVYTLQREVELAKTLPVHANIAFYENEVYRFENDAGEEHDYAIMQYYPQGNLSQYVKTQFLDATMRKSLVEGILLGLAHLHQNNLVHRDLKPSNILITLDDENQPVPKIADFGISKVAEAGKSLSNSGTSFTLAYMSPEQGRLKKIDHRSDLWAIGAVLYFICTGRHAFTSNDSDTEAQQADIRDKVLNAILPNDIAQLPTPYNEMVRRCLIDDRNQRAQSATELLLLLDPTITIPNNLPNQKPPVLPDNEGTIFEKTFPRKPDTPTQKPTEKIITEKQKPTTTEQAPASINKQVYMLIGIALLFIIAIILGLRGCGNTAPNNNSQANNTTTTTPATTTITEPTPITTTATTTTPSTTTTTPIEPIPVPDSKPDWHKRYDEVQSYTSAPSLPTVRKGKKWGIVDASTEKELIKPQYDAPIVFMDGKAQVIQNSKTFTIDKNNKCLDCETPAPAPNPTPSPKPTPTPSGNDYGIEMVYVQGGTFTMGCTSEQSGCGDDEKPAHTVSLSSFSIGKYEVTQAQWRAVMGDNPSDFSGCDRCPVEQVSWDDVQKFISKLNQLTGKRYRLPTEAEWEYAARGGSRSNGYQYSGSNNIGSVAWYEGNGGNKTHTVGSKSPNELGIYDMTGNVWEWCSDWYDANYYKSSPSSNPKGPSSGNGRVLRGGSWYFDAEYCRVANRYYSTPSARYYSIGFRLLLVP